MSGTSRAPIFFRAARLWRLKQRKSRLHSAPVNFFKRTICWIGAALFFTARFGFAQTTPVLSPSAAHEKLEVETISSISLDKRRQLLSALTPEAREKFSEQFLKLPPGGPSNGKINALFFAWSGVNPSEAIANAKKFPTVDTRRVAMEAICFGMKPEGSKTIALSIRNLPDDALSPQDKERLLGMAIAKWSQADPAAAAQFLADVYPNAATRLLKPGAGDGDLLIATKAVGANWGAIAPQAALDWFQKKQQPESPIAVGSVIFGWWRKDPKAAAAYVSAHVATPNERDVAALMAAPMAERDPSVAIRWAEWIKEETLRRRTRLGIAQLWASKDPKAAATWARGLAGKEGEDAIAAVAEVWAFSDSAAVEKWIMSLHGPARDSAIRGYAVVIAKKNPKLALTWIGKMEDSKARMRLTKTTVTDWMNREPDKSKDWIKKSKLSETQKKELLESGDRL